MASQDNKVLGTRLSGKVAIVTGGGSGFGEAICKRFAEEGAKVAVADMDAIGGERVANATHPHSMFFIKTNVANEGDWETLMENTLAKWGRVDILINNAGTSYRNKVWWNLGAWETGTNEIQPTIDVTEDEFDKVFAVNVKSINRQYCFHWLYQAETGSGLVQC
jgi:NAD(P)-dependent dehydrogenase (short-subunit alcohol dehydrogenase family)